MAQPTAAVDNAASVPTGTHPSINIPLSFKIYCSKSRLTYSEFYIGHEKGQKLHAISTGYKRWFKTAIGLHQGPDVASPLLGSALMSGGAAIEVTLPASGPYATDLKSSLSYDISFDLPIEGFPAPEHFEWRRSKGPEVESLQGRGKGGWVLTRVGHGAELGEPVAAYSVDLGSMKHSGDFAFLNSGQTGKLGAEFAVVAVLTALSLGQKKRNDWLTMIAII